MGTTPNYNINYEDERFQEVENQKQEALTDIEKTYGGMADQVDSYYDKQIQLSKDWAEQQAKTQQENTDFAIEKIEQQKAQTQKDYTREQSGAYVDWQKQSNQYGANAEQMAMQGLAGSGYSESSQVAMYNAYQSRVVTAREVLAQAMLNYDNNIKEAILQNNSALAEITFKALQQQLEIGLEGFQYKNTLLMEMANKKQEAEDRYYSRYQDVISQMNQENALAEQIRQYNEEMALKQQQLAEEIRQFNEEIARLKAKDKQEYEMQIKELELKKQQLEEEKRQFDASLKASQSSSSSSKKSSGYGDNSKTYALETEYYQGNYNSDCQYGTFSNGYQPNNINGNKLSNSNRTYTFDTKTLSGKKQTLTQTVWLDKSTGKYYYWEGRDNKYIELKYNKKTDSFSDK